jgi:hypothetical protein
MVRLIVVLLISLTSVALWAPDVPRVFGHPLATTGFTTNSAGVVTAVEPGSPAERSGIRAGERIDFAATTLQSRVLLVNQNLQNLFPEQQFPVSVIHSGRPATVMVSSNPETARDTATVLPRIAFDVLLLAAGVALVLLRPTKATWAFFILTAFNPGLPINAVIWFGPPVYQIAMTILTGPAFATLSGLAALVFALYLLVGTPIPHWRRVVEALAYLAGTIIIVLPSWSIVSCAYYGIPFNPGGGIVLPLQLATAVAPPILLLATYTSSDTATRERIRWVILGFAVNTLVFCLYYISSALTTFVPPYWLWAVLAAFDTCAVASTVLYAVLKHHIIDVNVAISRALVYTILSAFLVGAFAIVDSVVARSVSTKNAGLFADIGLALLLGFSFNSLHYRVDRLVDRLLFRARHAAEEHLRTVIRGMPFATSRTQVDHLLLEEPVRSFALTGAILFARQEDGPFDFRDRIGTLPDFSIRSHEDSLPAYLQGERRALRLSKHGWDLPAVAIPVFSHGDLTAIVIYGLHENGTDLDNEEIELFSGVAEAAGNAYDRLEALRLRERLRELLPLRA